MNGMPNRLLSLQSEGHYHASGMSNPGTAQPRRTIVLFGVPFHDIDMAGTLVWIEERIAERKPTYIVTANLDFAAQASRDVELQRILVEAGLVVCDGTPLVWASRLAGHPLRERVAGADLVPRLATVAEKKGYRIFLLGGAPDVLARAASNLMAKHPDLPPVACYSPPFAPLHELDNAAIVERLEQAKPDILLVAFGCPKQEKWILMHYRRLGIPCCIGVGATVDFLAGEVSRAPGLVGKLGLEWVYRLLQEPRRLAGRYAHDIRFLLTQIVRERLTGRTSAGTAPALTLPAHPHGIEVLRWRGLLGETNSSALPQPALRMPFIIDLSGITQVDSSGLGLLADVIRRAWQSEVGACFLGASPALLARLRAAKLDRLLPLEDTPERAVDRVRREAAALRMVPPATEEGRLLLFQMPPRLTAENAADCFTAVRDGWESRSRMRVLVLDLEDTTFIDSSGLGVLLKLHGLVAGRSGASMRLTHPHPNVVNVIRLAKVGELLLPA